MVFIVVVVVVVVEVPQQQQTNKSVFGCALEKKVCNVANKTKSVNESEVAVL